MSLQSTQDRSQLAPGRRNCPVCGAEPVKRVERENRGVMLGDYADAADHIWFMKWLVA